MAKNDLWDFDQTFGNNTDVGGQSTQGSSLVSTIDSIFQKFMAVLAGFAAKLGGTGTVGGTGDAITLTTSATWPISSLVNGTVLSFKAGSANTGAVTINVDGKGAKAIRRQGDTALVANDLVANAVYQLRYDSAYNGAAGAWVLLNPSPFLYLDAGSDKIPFWDDSAGKADYLSLTSNLVISGTELRVIETHGIALSDETTAITTGTGKGSFSLPYAFTLVGVYVTLNTASSSGTPTFDFNEGGTTCLSTKVVIDANEFTGGSSGYQGTAAAAAVISDSSLAAFAQLTWDIDVAGTGAKGAKAYIIGYRP